nr:hypothetical protein CFP56_60335 [Quercus suber]
MVSDLFLPESRRWNEELIDLNFYHWEAEVIKGISVSQFVDLDTLVWPLSSDGVYSVRSAYRLFVELNRQRLPGSLSLELVREALPTKINLCKRQVVIDGMCEQCRDLAEDSIHALWFCDSVKSIWMSDQCFSFLHSNRKIPRLAVHRGDIQWKPPASGLFKVNFDGAFFDEQACVEALATQRAVVFAQELCLQAVEVEGDSLKVIQALVAAKPSRTLFGNVIADIHSLVANFNCSFCHVKREGSKLAHALARRAVVFVDFDVWVFYQIKPCINQKRNLQDLPRLLAVESRVWLYPRSLLTLSRIPFPSLTPLSSKLCNSRTIEDESRECTSSQGEEEGSLIYC